MFVCLDFPSLQRKRFMQLALFKAHILGIARFPGIPLHYASTLHQLLYIPLVVPCIPLALYSHTFPWHSPAFPCIPCIPLAVDTDSHTFPWHFAPTTVRSPGISLYFPATLHPLPYVPLAFPCIYLNSPSTLHPLP